MARTAKIAKSLKKPKFKVRVRNRCRCCGRARGYIRKFQMCRICFRGMALKGEIPRVDVPVSKLKTEIARILKEEGYISTYKLVDENKTRKMLRVFLKYTPDRHSVITGLKRISRPGARAYLGAADIRPVVGGLGISIMTTPRGLMSGRAARKAKVGGEILCEVW